MGYNFFLDGYLRWLEGDSVCRSMRRLIAMSAYTRPSRGFEFRPVRKAWCNRVRPRLNSIPL